MQTKTVSSERSELEPKAIKKNRPAKISRNFETHRDVSLPSRKTRKSTQEAKLETLRRKTVRNLKQGKI